MHLPPFCNQGNLSLKFEEQLSVEASKRVFVPIGSNKRFNNTEFTRSVCLDSIFLEVPLRELSFLKDDSKLYSPTFV